MVFRTGVGLPLHHALTRAVPVPIRDGEEWGGPS